jgi:medium-chain acyl-[acyl-carrier-protein] hydrolase
VFGTWPKKLPDDVEVCTIELPGRASRVSESPLGSVAEIVEAVTPALLERIDRPFAFFGHGFGAITSFEVTRQLRRDGRPLPQQLFLSGGMAPHRYWFPSSHYLPRAEFYNALRIFDILRCSDGELDELTERMFRADVAVMASYVFVPEPPLDVPITALLGLEDSFCPVQANAAWKDMTTGAFAWVRLPGDQFYPKDDCPELMQIISGVFQAWRSAAARSLLSDSSGSRVNAGAEAEPR